MFFVEFGASTLSVACIRRCKTIRGLITMSVRFASLCRASRHFVAKLSEILVSCMFVMSLSMLLMYESSARTLFLGGVQVLVFLYPCVTSSVSLF